MLPSKEDVELSAEQQEILDRIAANYPAGVDGTDLVRSYRDFEDIGEAVRRLLELRLITLDTRNNRYHSVAMAEAARYDELEYEVLTTLAAAEGAGVMRSSLYSTITQHKLLDQVLATLEHEFAIELDPATKRYRIDERGQLLLREYEEDVLHIVLEQLAEAKAEGVTRPELEAACTNKETLAEVLDYGYRDGLFDYDEKSERYYLTMVGEGVLFEANEQLTVTTEPDSWTDNFVVACLVVFVLIGGLMYYMFGPGT